MSKEEVLPAAPCQADGSFGQPAMLGLSIAQRFVPTVAWIHVQDNEAGAGARGDANIRVRRRAPPPRKHLAIRCRVIDASRRELPERMLAATRAVTPPA
jgi:hypothetical protein